MLNIDQIKELIPHRYPFLLVDKILDLEVGKKAIGIKNVSANEPFFQGHFPKYPIMPGVLIVEAMAQVGAIAMMSMEENLPERLWQKGVMFFFIFSDDSKKKLDLGIL